MPSGWLLRLVSVQPFADEVAYDACQYRDDKRFDRQINIHLLSAKGVRNMYIISYKYKKTHIFFDNFQKFSIKAARDISARFFAWERAGENIFNEGGF